MCFPLITDYFIRYESGLNYDIHIFPCFGLKIFLRRNYLTSQTNNITSSVLLQTLTTLHYLIVAVVFAKFSWDMDSVTRDDEGYKTDGFGYNEKEKEFFYVGMGAEGTAKRAAVKLLNHDVIFQILGCEFIQDNGEWFLYFFIKLLKSLS